MRLRLSLTVVVVAAFLAAARAQEEPPQDGTQIIDDFVTTRGVVFEEPGGKKPAAKAGGKKGAVAQNRPRRRPARKGGAQGVKADDGGAAETKKAAAPAQDTGGEVGADAAVLKAGGAGRPIALGYTLYRRAGGQLVVADGTGEFRQYDQIRIFLETNTDGYVYVFNTTDGAAPVMLYPYAHVGRGRNAVAAHTRDFVPAGSDFEFDANPGIERVHIVFSRRPLAGVPAGEELVARCGGAVEHCYWEPTPAEWSRVEATLRQGGRVREGRFAHLARLRPVSPDTLTRGLRIKREEPPPAVVRVNDSPAAELLVTTIDLIHK